MITLPLLATTALIALWSEADRHDGARELMDHLLPCALASVWAAYFVAVPFL